MNSVILDCSYGMSVYVLKDDKEYSFISCDEKKHSDELLVVLDDLLKQAELKISQIQNICVCIGPGSFTGIRVAISVCKGLAIGVDAKIYVLSNLDVFDIEKKDNSVLVLEGFSNFVYARIFKNGKLSDKCLTLNELELMIKNEKMETYTYQEKMQNILKNSEICVNVIKNNIKNAFLKKINLNEYSNINQIEPIYLRASQAEIERNKKLMENKL